jgi:hypothetical protein
VVIGGSVVYLGLFAVAITFSGIFDHERVVANNGNSIELTVANSELAYFTILPFIWLVSFV